MPDSADVSRGDGRAFVVLCEAINDGRKLVEKEVRGGRLAIRAAIGRK